ncbi:MAG: DUF6610 family protein [Anaerolineales bacterium]
MTPPLVYCAAGNRRFAQIAVDAGWLYGAQLPGTVYTNEVAPLWFADQDWSDPRREAYMAALAEHRPQQATVLDLERAEQFAEVLGWAEEAAQYVERVVIIPKVFGIIPRIPGRVAGVDVVLGYSVPTRYAGTEVPVWEFERRPVHLLGGSPHAQLRLRHYLNVVSADGNYIQEMATRRCAFWMPGDAARYAKNRFGPTLREADGERWGNGGDDADAHLEAFRRSCENVMAAWRRLN